MNQPLPSHFQLNDAELPALERQVQDLEQSNNRTKWLLVLVLFSLILTAFYVVVITASERTLSLWILLGSIPFILIMLLMFAGFMAAIVGRLGSDSALAKPFLRTPDDGLRRYSEFRVAESKYQDWFQRTQDEFWNALSGTQFEREVANLLNKSGFTAQLTSSSGDGGVDIILDDGTIIQCKARRGPCGPAALRELFGSLHDFGAHKAILISREGFTSASRQFAEGKPIDLWDRNTLIALQKRLGCNCSQNDF